MILFDTSIWVEHLSRKPQATLADALESDTVAMHPHILGELILGGLSFARQTDFGMLPLLDVAPPPFVYAFIQKYSLSKKGVGWVDANLLYSAWHAKIQLITLDRRMAKAFAQLT